MRHITYNGKSLCGATLSAESSEPCLDCFVQAWEMVDIVLGYGRLIAGALRQEAANLDGFSGRPKTREQGAKMERRVSILREIAKDIEQQVDRHG